MNTISTLILIALISTAAYISTLPSNKQNLTSYPSDSVFPYKDTKETEVQGTGTIIYNGVEGGCYGIESDSGTVYRLAKRSIITYPVGAKVRFRGITKNVVSSYMWGKYLELTSIEQIN